MDLKQKHTVLSEILRLARLEYRKKKEQRETRNDQKKTKDILNKLDEL